MPPAPTISLEWALDKLPWLLLLRAENLDVNCDLQCVRIEKTIECLLPYLVQLHGELMVCAGMEEDVQWHAKECNVVVGVADIVARVDVYLTSVFAWCVKLEDLRLCLGLKDLTMHTFDVQQLVIPLKKKCLMASRLVEMEMYQLSALVEEVAGCTEKLLKIRSSQLGDEILANTNLGEVFNLIQRNDISHLSGYSAKLAALSVLSPSDGSLLSALQHLSCRIDAMRFSMVLFTQQATDFLQQCNRHFPKSCQQLQRRIAALEEEWARTLTEYTLSKSVLLDRNCNSLFLFLVNQTILAVVELKARAHSLTEDAMEDADRIQLKLCSGVINFVHNAFQEETVARPDVIAKYNDVLLTEWEQLNHALLDPSPQTDRAANQAQSPFCELRSPFNENRPPNTLKTPDFLRCLTLLRTSLNMAESAEVTPDTTPRNTPVIEFKPHAFVLPKRNVSKRDEEKVVGLGLDLGLEFNQSSTVPLSVMKKDRIVSLNVDPATVKGFNLHDKLSQLQESSTVSKLGSPAKLQESSIGDNSSRIPRIMNNITAAQIPIIEKQSANGSRIPVISRTHPVFSSIADKALAKEFGEQNDHFAEKSVLYTSLRTPPGFNLSSIRDSSTPRSTHRVPSHTTASYCLGLMTPNNTLGSVAEQYTPEVLDWGSRSLLRQRSKHAAATPAHKHPKRPWK